MPKPRVSVVMPMFNAETYVSRAVASVLAQRMDDFELIVVDDGSTDRGPEIVESVGDERIRLIRQENAGDAGARNRGAREARGDLLAFLDSDDEWDPAFLEAVRDLHEAHPEAGLLVPGLRRLYAGGFAVDVTVRPVAGGNGAGSSVLIHDYFKRAREHPFVTSSNVAIPRRVFEEVGPFRGLVGAGSDRDMWARVALRFPLACDTRILATYHCEHVSGRVSRRRKLSPTFAETARREIDAGQVTGGRVAEVREYVNYLWTSMVYRHVTLNNREEALRILREEIAATSAYRWFVWRFRLMLGLLPAALVRWCCRVERSRWWFLVSNTLAPSKGLVLRPTRRGVT